MPLFEPTNDEPEPTNDDPDESPAEDSVRSIGSFETARAELRRRSAVLNSEANQQVEAEPNPSSGADAPRRQEANMEQVQWQDQGSQAAGAATGLHPFFRGLLESVPAPGTEWPLEGREQWLETARNIFALMYQEPGDERERARPVPTPVEPQQQSQ